MENSQKPAFANMPSHTDPQHTIGEYGGLTKREYFAAMAMQGICSNVDWAKTIEDDWDDYKERVVAASLELTDELLKQPGNE